jgi:hypothetical protein
MELTQYQLQIFVSLVVILAGCVALLVDFLKRNNEQLRELTLELRVRREQEHRRPQTPPAQPMIGPAPVRALTTVKTENHERPAAEPIARAAVEHKRAPSPDALAAMERGARLAASPRAKRAAAQMQPDPKVELAPAQVAVVPQSPVIEVVPKTEVITPRANKSKMDWSALLARRADPVVKSAITIPSGFHDGFVLSQLVQSRQPVSGLVVSIGVNAARDGHGPLPQQVTDLVHSLIGPGDFACQAGEEEFLLIYPSERGASAQRRLSQIAQQLWDFQLRSLGTFQILFSWGGIEVKSESIGEAVASANERMRETRRGRKLLTMQPRGELCRAV